MLAIFSTVWMPVVFAGIFAGEKCKIRDCTLGFPAYPDIPDIIESTMAVTVS